MDNARVIAIHPQFVVDETGRRRSVVLSLEEFEELMELVEDRNDSIALDEAVERSTGLEEFSTVMDDLKRDGLV